ncbi:hypothetical protein DGMP_11760 [Desulfomarina profundi]|uniref:Uncharacterized protein n=1 Tax=Desulfomarina profundi TaxID=2772557 RepID=A0A8D5JD29_9BACT|nr:hypothetical protein [Desulfomarina profundi]BCL60483.1 hypothetical protein DGMP_11760 [Desulfomarina profundi]
MNHISYHTVSVICPENDLESHTILKLAEELGLDVRKSHQPWGARLETEPEETFQDLKTTVIIVEIPGPEKEEQLRREGHTIIIVDHHQYDDLDRTHPLSSLEQFTEHLNIRFSDPQHSEMKYIAANDRDFLYGLLEAGADYETMCEIRRRERELTGVAPELYNEVEQAIHHKWSFGDLEVCVIPEKYQKPLAEIIRFPDKKTWLDCQRTNKHLILKKCLIISHHDCIDPTRNKITPCRVELYGPNKWREPIYDIINDKRLKAHFKMWYGGGHSRFFGALARRDTAPWDTLLTLLLEFCLTSGRPVRSWNTTFLFPFILEKDGESQQVKLQEKAIESPHTISDADSTAAALHFLPTVRKLFFSSDNQKSTHIKRIVLPHENNQQKDQLIVTHKEKKLSGTPEEAKDKFKAELDIEHLAIYSFPNNNIQILSFKVCLPAIEKEINFDSLEQPLQLFEQLCKNNNLRKTLPLTAVSHLLKVNNLLRILYMTFVAQESEGKNPDTVELKTEGRKITSKLSMTATGNTLKNDLVPPISTVIETLVGRLVKTENKQIVPLLDDRLFLISHFGLWGNKPEKKAGQEYYEALYSLGLYVDTEGNNEPVGYLYDPDVVKTSIQNNTDRRWYGPSGNLYGYTNYSNIYMGFGRFFADEIAPTIHNHYVFMALLTLYHRVSLINYLHRLSLASEELMPKVNHFVTANKIQKLRTEFIRFDSIFFHREISAALQGEELYEKCRKAMKVEQLFEKVRQKLQQLDEFLQAQRASLINRYGFGLAIIALILTFLATLQATPKKLLFIHFSQIKSMIISHLPPELLTCLKASFFTNISVISAHWIPYIIHGVFILIPTTIILRLLYKKFLS